MERLLNNVVHRIKPDLGIADYDVIASLYKMLVYGEGDFFLSHKDSEKEKGMFGTLIVALPSRHTGGELLIRFDGKEENVDFAGESSNFKMPYAAFYADCEHEIKPITSGYRVCLVYNLVQQKAAAAIKLSPLGGRVAKLADLFEQKVNHFFVYVRVLHKTYKIFGPWSIGKDRYHYSCMAFGIVRCPDLSGLHISTKN